MRLEDIDGITQEKVDYIRYLAKLFGCQSMKIIVDKLKKYDNIEIERIKK